MLQFHIKSPKIGHIGHTYYTKYIKYTVATAAACYEKSHVASPFSAVLFAFHTHGWFSAHECEMQMETAENGLAT